MKDFIIPAIDIMHGKCVRLTKGEFASQKIYNEHPLEVARQFEDAGLCRLHLVDLDGARAGGVRNWKVLEAIAGKTSLQIDFGGGVNTEKDVEIVLNSGAAWVGVGSVIVKDETSFLNWLKVFGPEKFLPGVDVRAEKVTVRGWTEQTDIHINTIIEKLLAYKISRVFCTDVSKDGALEGPGLDLYKMLLDEFQGLQLIASGGVSVMDDVYRLKELGCAGVIVGKAIYEGRIPLSDISKRNAC